MKMFIRTAIAATAIASAAPSYAAVTIGQPVQFTFDTTKAGTATGSGNGNALTYTATTGSSTVTMKATGWSRDFGGNFIASQIVPFIGNGLGIIQPTEGGGGNYHQIDNVNGWEFAILQFDRAVSLQSATLNTFRLWDRNYVDNDAFIAFNTSNLSMADALTASQARTLFDTRLAGANSDSTWFTSNLQDYSLPISASSNVWIIGGSFNGPDGQNDAFKLASVTVAAVPEPATWAMMLIGFGMIGGTMRKRTRAKVSFA